MESEKIIEELQKRLVETSEELWKTREKAFYLQLALTRATYYLTKGYADTTEKNDYTAMRWEEFLMEEAKNAG